MTRATMISRYEVYINARSRRLTQADAAAIAEISTRTASRYETARPKKVGRKSEGRRISTRRDHAVRLARVRTTRGNRTLPAFPNARRIASELLRRFACAVSPRTVLNDLRARGYRTLVRPRHPNLGNPEARLSFARRYRNVSATLMIFSDEHFISTNDNSTRTMLVGPGETPLPREVQRRQNVPNCQVWAAIGFGWRSPLVIFPKINEDDDRAQPGGFRLNARSYIRRCLCRIMPYLVSSGKIFMHDGARAHTANATRDYLARKGVNLMVGYPASSPDFNPIESVWALLNQRLAEMMPRNQVELVAFAIRAWNEIPQAAIDGHILAFNAKCDSVAASRGV